MKHEQPPNLVGLIFAFIFIVVFVHVAISADIQSEIDFETQILPILKNRCFSCHSAPTADSSGTITKPKGSVQLDSVKGIEESLYGEVIIAGEPEASLLYQRITLPEGDTGIMPPSEAGTPLTKPETDLIRKWIEQGSAYGEWTGNQSESKPLTTDIHPHQPTVMPPITALVFSHDGKMVKFARLKKAPLNVAWLNNGSRVVAACADGVVRLVDPDSVEVTGEIHALNSWAYSLAVHPTDGGIIVGGPNAQVRRIILK